MTAQKWFNRAGSFSGRTDAQQAVQLPRLWSSMSMPTTVFTHLSRNWLTLIAAAIVESHLIPCLGHVCNKATHRF